MTVDELTRCFGEHFSKDEIEDIGAVALCLGATGFNAYCHGTSLAFLLQREVHPRASKARDRAGCYSRWSLRSLFPLDGAQ